MIVASAQSDVIKFGTALAVGSRSERDGALVEPTMLTNVGEGAGVFREEIFGPVASLIKFSTEEQVAQIANDSELGLASYLYSRDIWRVSEELEYGIEDYLKINYMCLGGIDQ